MQVVGVRAHIWVRDHPPFCNAPPIPGLTCLLRLTCLPKTITDPPGCDSLVLCGGGRVPYDMQAKDPGIRSFKTLHTSKVAQAINVTMLVRGSNRRNPTHT